MILNTDEEILQESSQKILLYESFIEQRRHQCDRVIRHHCDRTQMDWVFRFSYKPKPPAFVETEAGFKIGYVVVRNYRDPNRVVEEFNHTYDLIKDLYKNSIIKVW